MTVIEKHQHDRMTVSGGQELLRTALVGVGGYAGAELANLLLRHPRLQEDPPLFLGRDDDAGTQLLDRVHPRLTGRAAAACEVLPFSFDRLRDTGTQAVFLATPHEQSRAWVPDLLRLGLRVIDLSGAWRLKETSNAAVYGLHDADPATAATLQAEAVYGCPELHREQIRDARLVANPGCYATSILLALAPLLQADLIDLQRGIVCDAKSGVSGAGKALKPTTHFMYAADNLSAYSVFGHRHVGELLEQLHLSPDEIQFTPHLLPIPRGILSTVYVSLKTSTSANVLEELFGAFYESSPLVRLHPSPDLPQIQHVVRTSFCDIGFELHTNGKRLVLVSCLDNLLKGASGQAVQNLNLMSGWKEEEGLL